MGKYLVKTTGTGIKFDLRDDDDKVIASSEVYKKKASCLGGVQSVIRNAPAAAVEDQTVEGYAVEKCPKFEIYKDKKGEFRFRLKATNGQIVISSGAYSSFEACAGGVEAAKKNAGSGILEA